jgi:Transglycosylase SLT domain
VKAERANLRADRRFTLSPRITATSLLRNNYRSPARLTFVAAAAAVAISAAVSSGVAAAGPASTAGAITSGHSRAAAISRPAAGHAPHIHTVAVSRAARVARVARVAAHGDRVGRPGQRHVAAAPGPCRSSQLHRWICHAEQILREHGTRASAINSGAAFIVVLHESGGNPHAYNGWDSNAAAGTPSEGIAQVIGPTFSAYSLPGHANIWNPIDNMIAAFRYAISRYGSMNNIPGVMAVRGGGSYVGY